LYGYQTYGYYLGKNARGFDRMFKETGIKMLTFRHYLFLKVFEAEEKNAEGFAKECAIVTHYRLKMIQINRKVNGGSQKLEEELIVRPTSEGYYLVTYKGWVQSYRIYLVN
jgi:prolyl-tRNA synthetase